MGGALIKEAYIGNLKVWPDNYLKSKYITFYAVFYDYNEENYYDFKNSDNYMTREDMVFKSSTYKLYYGIYDVSENVSFKNWFKDSNIVALFIDALYLENLNNIIDISNMFCNCKYFLGTYVGDYDPWDIERLFKEPPLNITLKDSSDSLQKVHNMCYLPNCTSYSGAFKNCTNLKYIYLDISKKLCNLSSIFEGCVNISLLYKFNPEYITNISKAFYLCSNLTSMTITDHTYPNTIRFAKNCDFSDIFNGCKLLHNLGDFFKLMLCSVSGLGNGINLDRAFKDCENLININLSGITLGSIIDTFYNCRNLSKIIDMLVDRRISSTSTQYYIKTTYSNTSFYNCPPLILEFNHDDYYYDTTSTYKEFYDKVINQGYSVLVNA